MRKEDTLADNEGSMSGDMPLFKSGSKLLFRFHGCLPGWLHLGDHK